MQPKGASIYFNLQKKKDKEVWEALLEIDNILWKKYGNKSNIYSWTRLDTLKFLIDNFKNGK